jgi:type IV pilus assembly protein PilF
MRDTSRLPANTRTALRVAGLALALLLAACANRDGGSLGGQPQQNGPRSQERLVSMNDGRPAGDPAESARVHTELAFAYFQSGQMAIALDEVKLALIGNANYYMAYNVLGLIHMDLGENAKAEEAFRRALSIAPSDSDTLNNYGWFLCQTQRERQAIPQFLAALKNPLYATPAKVYVNAGICSDKFGDTAAAEDYYRKAFSLEPGNGGAMYRLAELYLRRNDVEKARFYIDRLNKSFEPSAQSLWLALRIERKAGDRTSESSFAAQLRRRFPNSAEYKRLQQGQFE